jgi:hypothetical protein
MKNSFRNFENFHISLTTFFDILIMTHIGIISGQCPSTRLVHWVPDRKIAHSNCSASLLNSCRSIAEHEQSSGAIRKRVSSFDCSLPWMSRKDIATGIQAQALSIHECPLHAAQDSRQFGMVQPGFIWGAHERAMSRGSLSSRYCEL